jgi:uncharacterized protein YjiS (DUF1127 family)
MSTVSLARPPRIQASVSPRRGAQFLRLASAFYAAAMRELRLRREMRRLAEYDDHMLRDIGIARTDIEGVIRCGRDRQIMTGTNWPPLTR